VRRKVLNEAHRPSAQDESPSDLNQRDISVLDAELPGGEPVTELVRNNYDKDREEKQRA